MFQLRYYAECLPAMTVSLKLNLAAVFGKSFNLRPLSLSSPLKFASSNTFGIKPAIFYLWLLLFWFNEFEHLITKNSLFNTENIRAHHSLSIFISNWADDFNSHFFSHIRYKISFFCWTYCHFDMTK